MAGNYNLNVVVSAEATPLRSALALAQQDVKTFGAEVRKAAADIKASSSVTAEQIQRLDIASASYNKARGQVAGLAAELHQLGSAQQAAAQSTEQVSTAHGHMAGSAGVAREAVVMLHETMMGNYTRLVGSTMVLAERTNALHLAFQALNGPMGAVAAGAVAVGGAFALLAMRAHEATAALREVGNTAVLQGRSGPQAQAAVQSLADGLQNTGIVGYAAAYKISGAIGQIGRVTDEQRSQINAIAPGFFIAFEQDAEKTSKQIGEIFASDTSLKAYLEKYQVLSTDQQRAWAESTTAAEKYQLGIDALAARLSPVIEKFRQAKQAADDWRGVEMATGGLGTPGLPLEGQPQPAMPPTGLGEFEPGTYAPSAQAQEATDTLLKYTTELRRAKELSRDLEVEEKARAEASAAGNTELVSQIDAAIQKIATEQAQLKNPGDADWSAKVGLQAEEAANKAVVAASNAHQQRLQITEAGLRAELQVYQQASQDMTRTDAERLAMKRRAIDIEMSLAKDEATGSTQAAKQAFEAKVASFDAEIAAARGNVGQIIGLEQQKLNYIRQAKGQESAEYQRAAKEETSIVAQAVNEQIRDIESAGQREVAAKRASLQDQVSLRQISKVQEMAQVEQLQQAVQAAELKQLDAIISGLDAGTLAYADAMKQRAKLVEQFSTENAKVQAQIDDAAEQSAEKETQVYTQAFSRIGSSAAQAFSGYLTYSTTWQRAEQQIARSALTSFVDLAETMVERWGVMELARVTSDRATNAVINAQQQSSSATGMAQLVAAVIGGENAKTSATIAGNAARTASDTAAATTSGVTEAASMKSSISGHAASAAAAVYDDVSQIPVVGWLLAPPAAAVAFAAVAGFGSMVPSFDVGSDYVPNDGLAMLHRGEIVVPAADSDVVRGGGGFTLGGGGGHTFNYAPTFHGAGADMARQSRRDFENYTGAMINAFRNGQTRLPGRG